MTETTDAPVLHTRPGCPFCTMLRADLDSRGVSYRELDIWQDSDAAAAVRAVADGNEIVPTVRVGDTWMVNPSGEQVVAALAEHAPGAS